MKQLPTLRSSLSRALVASASLLLLPLVACASGSENDSFGGSGGSGDTSTVTGSPAANGTGVSGTGATGTNATGSGAGSTSSGSNQGNCEAYDAAGASIMGSYVNDALDERTFAVLRMQQGGGYYDQMVVQVTWAREEVPTGVTIPKGFDLASANDTTCQGCVEMLEGCADLVACATSYFGHAGLLVVEEATQSKPGTFKATLTNVRLEEWNYADHAAIPGGKCLYIESLPINVSF